MIECHPISRKFVPTSGPAVKVSRTGDELDVKPLPNMGLWNRFKMENQPKKFRSKPEDIEEYLQLKKEYDLSYGFLIDLDEKEQEKLLNIEKILPISRQELLQKYKDDKDWIHLILTGKRI